MNRLLRLIDEDKPLTVRCNAIMVTLLKWNLKHSSVCWALYVRIKLIGRFRIGDWILAIFLLRGPITVANDVTILIDCCVRSVLDWFVFVNFLAVRRQQIYSSCGARTLSIRCFLRVAFFSPIFSTLYSLVMILFVHVYDARCMVIYW